jgi:sugar phosphate isomerase/epimerase
MTLDDNINHIHVKDKGGNKNIRIRKNLDEFDKAFAALKRINYSGIFILETNPFPNAVKEASINLETTRNYMRFSQ